MKKILKLLAMVACVGAMLGLSGCGVSEEDIRTEVEKLVLKHLQQNKEAFKDFNAGSFGNFKVVKESKHHHTGSIGIVMTDKKTKKSAPLNYKFKLDTESNQLEVMPDLQQFLEDLHKKNKPSQL